MAQKTVKGSAKLGQMMRERREELGLTMEQMAKKAGVGTKSWSRYESGEGIRADKVSRILRALGWASFPEGTTDGSGWSVDEEKVSPYFSARYGETAARAFAVSFELLSDEILHDMDLLAKMPKDTHLGQVEQESFLSDRLPEQFLTDYDYQFLYAMECTLRILCMRIHDAGGSFVVHTVMEEILLVLLMEIVRFLSETDFSEEKGWMPEDFAFDLCGDMDVVTWLYSGIPVNESHTYHFSHWLERQFHIE